MKSNPALIAKQVIMKALESGDLGTAHKVLDRLEGRKLKVSGDSANPVVAHVIKRDMDPHEASRLYKEMVRAGS